MKHAVFTRSALVLGFGLAPTTVYTCADAYCMPLLSDTVGMNALGFKPASFGSTSDASTHDRAADLGKGAV
jgi:hypothetical protein